MGAWFLNLRYHEAFRGGGGGQHWLRGTCGKGDGPRLPVGCDDGAFSNHPSLKHAFDVGLESGRKGFLDLVLITQIVTFCHCGGVGVRE